MTKQEPQLAAEQKLPAHTRQSSLIVRMGERFGVDPDKLMGTLKATAFKQQKDGPDISNEQMMALLIVADQYQLNPFTKEIFAFADKGGIVPIVSVDGWARIVNGHPAFDGVDFEDGEEAQSCKCIMYRKDRRNPVTITEYLAECHRNTGPWNSHPMRMLRHKAYIQCARLAFGFSGIYDEDEGRRILEKDITPDSQRISATQALLKGKEQSIDVNLYTETAGTVEAGTGVINDEA